MKRERNFIPDYHSSVDILQAFLRTGKPLIGLCAVSFSTYFFTQIISISPVYWFFLVAFLYIIVEKLTNLKFSLSSGILISFPFFLLVVLYQVLNNSSAKPFALIGVGFSFFFIVNYFEKGKDSRSLERVIFGLNVINAILFIAEMTYRFYFSLTTFGERFLLDGFYVFKYQSFMFMDSNPVGMILMLLLFLNVWVGRNGANTVFFKWLFGGLLVLTFCRAAIFTSAICLIILKLFDKGTCRIAWLLLIFCCLFVLIFKIALSDTSFLYRLDIIFATIDYLQKCSIEEMLWGLGDGEATKILGRGAHNMFVYLIIEYGLIGTATWLLFNFWVLINSKFKSLILFVPFFIAGQVFAPLVIPYYFAFAALGFQYSEKKEKEAGLV